MFWSGPFPQEVSVDRADHCDAQGKARANGREVVYVRAGEVREQVRSAWVIPDKLPDEPEHALILLSLRTTRFQRFSDKETDLRPHATAWDEYSQLAMRLPLSHRPTSGPSSARHK